jgi:anti-anti-sigma factor
MPSTVTSSQQGSQLTIVISGRFDFSILQDFRNAYTSGIEGKIEHVVIDLCESEHMDSSGMGLLLTLKKELYLDAGCVDIIHCRPHVKDALLAAQLNHFFRFN